MGGDDDWRRRRKQENLCQAREEDQTNVAGRTGGMGGKQKRKHVCGLRWKGRDGGNSWSTGRLRDDLARESIAGWRKKEKGGR